MKRFLLQIVLPVIFSSLLLWIVVIFLLNGKTDPFYLRFTGERTKNLILGTSRAAQGIQPQPLDSILSKRFYNFSFTVYHSPFGPVYNRAIKSKLDITSDDQIFIVAVDPWSISSKCIGPNDSSLFREERLSLGRVKSFTSTPNIEYVRKELTPNQIIRSSLNSDQATMILQSNGWLKVNVPMDSIEVLRNTQRKVDIYRSQRLPVFKYSEARNNSLFRLIKWLKTYGEVYLIRLPIHEEMLNIEIELMPTFQDKIESSINISDGYFDMTELENQFRYTDGNHLYKESGFEVSLLIGEWIKERQKFNAQDVVH